MKLTFQIDYNLGWGESMYIIGSLPSIANGLRMEPGLDGKPTVTIEVSPAQAVFEYAYEVRRDNGTTRHEWGAPRSLRLDAHLIDALILDRWQDLPADKPFFSSAFTNSIFRHEPASHIHSTKGATLEIRVNAPTVPSDHILAIAGSCQALGHWDPAQAPAMIADKMARWTIQIPMENVPERFEFKFVMLRADDRSVTAWEEGDNRCFVRPPLGANSSLIISGLFFENPLPRWRGCGTAIPVFSLRSERGLGVGEFADIKQMVDWAAATGQQFIQLLPINDTTMSHTWTDSYPYTTNSTFALHPMYLDIEQMGQLPTKELRELFDNTRRELNALPCLDYEAVNNAKRMFSRAIFDCQGAAEMTSEQFKQFALRNDEWLMPYAAWCVLRDKFGTPDMSQWGPYATYSPELIDQFIKANRTEIDFVRYIQFHLDKQLRQVTDYASNHGVVLKGDIPIGISRCSVDAWLNPHLFNFTCTAGAPPDAFATLGQNWGFPTYRWDVMARDGYAWWRARLSKMAEYFSAYRIDHLLGFFRIWQIPADTLHGLLGIFCPALPLSPEEMADDFGFEFHPHLHTRPYITDEIINSYFGPDAPEVRRSYLTLVAPSHHAMRPEFATQCSIASHFAKMEHNDRNSRICSGLMNLLDDVLFIADPYEPGRFHPRIDAAKTHIYKTLSEEQKQAFDNLYDNFFYHRHNEFWQKKALEKLPALIDSTGMLACAEDLGMIPACVPQVMEQLQILSLEIQRMPKNYGLRFGNPSAYPYLSVCSTSTHDMPGLRQWWEEDYERAADFYRNTLHLDGDAPREATPEVCRATLAQNLSAPSMLCILPLQDWLSIDASVRRDNPADEQINVPANPHHYWRYRMHITLDQLLEATTLTAQVTELISASGR